MKKGLLALLCLSLLAVVPACKKNGCCGKSTKTTKVKKETKTKKSGYAKDTKAKTEKVAKDVKSVK